ncbi:Rab11 family-interacting protein 3 [Sciurus carolinensis]|uniref:Rab11 family-interacting protein 3 n=1 Tax=Sciurus carolinensis TaxID=30640 RepID=A0AA41MWV6_SCICA|nr:Rab11 family-interacting protein 3 [Sciurus carolinensis]
MWRSGRATPSTPPLKYKFREQTSIEGLSVLPRVRGCESGGSFVGPTHSGSPAPLPPGEPAAGPEDDARLRAVFDALDGDGDGFVRIEDFVQFATVYGAEQVKDLTQYLDPSGLGVISFEDFYQGITAIKNGEPDGHLPSMAPAQDEEPPACADDFDDFVTYEASVPRVVMVMSP